MAPKKTRKPKEVPPQYFLWLHKEVVKKSTKPFKSGKVTAKVMSLGLHPITKESVFYFHAEEQDYFVECRQCELKVGCSNGS